MTRSFPGIGLAALAALALVGGCMKMNKQPPKDMPAYAPLYPGSQNVMSVVVGPETSDMMTTSDTPDVVLAYYRAQAAANGLQETQTPTQATTPDEQKASFADTASGRMLVVLAKPNDPSHAGLTMVDITFPTPKAPS
jgi:hypothetical protein